MRTIQQQVGMARIEDLMRHAQQQRAALDAERPRTGRRPLLQLSQLRLHRREQFAV
jgi:hypothetical protein